MEFNNLIEKDLRSEGLIGLAVCLKNVGLYRCLNLVIPRAPWRND